MGNVMSLTSSSRNLCSNMFLVFGFLISACSAKSPLPDISPLYPFNGGNSFKPTPFAPANDQAWINMMWWKSLAGKPVESAPGLVNPYDDNPHSIDQYLLARLEDKTVPGITPGAYQKWTQYSNPAADYIGYGLFSNPLGHKGNTPPLGSTLFQPGNDLFWLMQFLQAQHRTPGGPIENNLLNQYNYLLNSQAPLKVDPYANYWAFKNSLRKRRSADGEENDEDEDDNVVVEEMVKASAMEDEEAAAEAEAQDAAEAQEAAEEQDAAEEEEANINDIYPDILRSYRAYLGADPTHEEEEEEEVVVDYRDWYENTYLPWYEQWDQKMAEYKLQMMAYEAAQYQQLVPSNPFGPVSFGNPYPFYSKSAYKQSLFDDVAGSADPAVTYKDFFEDWKD